MTKEEFLNLRQHDRVKFIGKVAPANGNILTIGKVYTVKHVWDYSKSNWADYKGLRLSLYTVGSFNVGDPTEWEVVAHRHDRVVAGTLNKRAISRSRITLSRCKYDLQRTIDAAKANFDYYLNKANLASKMQFLSHLNPEEKRLAEFLFEFDDIDKVLETWEKGKDNGAE